MDSHQPSTPAAHTRMSAQRLKTKVYSGDVGLEGETAGGISVGFEGGMKGVAGERCVASTWLLERRDRRDEIEPRAEPLADGVSASAIVGLLCGSRDDCSVGPSSSTASSSAADVSLLAGASDKVKPR